MRTITLIFFVIPLFIFSQNRAPRAKIESIISSYQSEINDSIFVNNKTLNILIGDVLNQYLPSTKISTQPASFVLDNDDNSLNLIGNYDHRAETYGYLNYLLSGGIKLKGEPTGSFYNFKDSNISI